MEISQIFAYIGLFLSFIVSIPQIIKMIQTKDVSGISMGTYILVILTNTCFLVRSVAINETPYIITNILKTLTVFVVFYLYYKYRKKI